MCIFQENYSGTFNMGKFKFFPAYGVEDDENQEPAAKILLNPPAIVLRGIPDHTILQAMPFYQANSFTDPAPQLM